MKILVIGQSVEDHINEKIIKPGGIYYSAAALVNVMETGDEIFLCTSTEESKEKLFEPVYGRLNENFFNHTPAIPVVHLTIHNDAERDEVYENINSSLKINFDQLNDMDCIYINMVTGYDITADQLEELRGKFSGPLYIDIHTLSRGFDENGKRNFRIIPEAERWIRAVDVIQVNESELLTLSSKKDPDEIVRMILNSGPRYVIKTMGDKGVRLFYMENNEITSIFISAIKINALNKVGCGDVFGAVYFYYYVKNRNILYALKKANIAAGLTASYSSFDEFSKLKNDVLSRYY